MKEFTNTIASVADQNIKTYRTEEPQQANPEKMDALLLAYLYIFQSVQVNHESARIISKGIANNARVQDGLIRQEEQMHLHSIPAGKEAKVTVKDDTLSFVQDAGGGNMANGGFAGHWTRHTRQVLEIVPLTEKEVNGISQFNQSLSADRGLIESKMTTLRQEGQINDTELNSAVNYNQQSMNEGKAIMDMLMAVGNQILKM